MLGKNKTKFSNPVTTQKELSIYAPMIYTAPYDMFLMRAEPLRVHGQEGGGWALEIEPFLGLVKCHRAVGRMPYLGAQKSRKEERHERGNRVERFEENQCWNFGTIYAG